MATQTYVHLTARTTVRASDGPGVPYISIVADPDASVMADAVLFLGDLGDISEVAAAYMQLAAIELACHHARVLLAATYGPEPGPDDPDDEPTDEPASEAEPTLADGLAEPAACINGEACGVPHVGYGAHHWTGPIALAGATVAGESRLIVNDANRIERVPMAHPLTESEARALHGDR